MSTKYNNLFQPLKIGSMEIKNRIVMAAMGVHDNEMTKGDGGYTQQGIDYFAERAKGGAGLIVLGAMQVQNVFESDAHSTSVSAAGKEYVESMKELADAIHAYGCKVVPMLTAGSGREAAFWLVKGDPISSSDGLPNVWNPAVKHRALTPDEIKIYIDGFAKGAKLAKEAGFDGVSIHAIHEGYLLDQFAIASMNTRTDQYGGSVENRLRFAKEIIDAIKEACGPDFPVMIRYSVTSKMKGFNDGALPGEEYKEFGRGYEESIEVAQYLEKIGYAALDVDNGTYDSWFWAHPPVYMPQYCNLEDAAFIKKHVNIPVICAGRMEDPEVCDKAIADGKIDGVGLARMLLADPEWPNKAKEGNKEDIRPCIGCHVGCLGRLFQGKRMGCAVNPATCREKQMEIKPVEIKKNVMIIGGGIAGMEAARVLALRGHNVSLYEKTGALGGAFISASSMSFKQADKELIHWFIRQIKKLSVNIHMNTEVTKELIAEVNPDEIICATGSGARSLSGVKGIESIPVINAIEALTGQKPVGENVVIIGGGLTGIELGYELTLQGKKVEIIEMKDKILDMPDLCAANSQMLRQIIKYHKIPIHTGASVAKFEDGKVCYSVNGEEKSAKADTVIISIGYISNKDLYDPLKQWKEKVHLIGDADRVSNLLNATWSAYELALTI
ncbi:2-enoate reductase [Anaerosolibacter carboniphilus]|uniref:2-enoate reductase n=1 Tax=Anaerosolibacter carboniphilus TaxID=1417629 RepID=A0A841KR38_9FIRM|nr:FAD-dependent oxidoreductase [Anaerosolibacter carboniphilus]MBB6215873.1 2-enoate reductase [Anaerosolibacter carboniphilus]